MVNLEVYKKFFDFVTPNELIDKFQDSLVSTNRTPEFFVDWKKVKENVKNIKVELSLWTSLVGSKEIEADFRALITEYPETIKTVPILLAIREKKFPIITDFFKIQKRVKQLDFNKKRYSKISEEEIESYLSFARSAGIFNLFQTIRNFYDYVLGVEVGMDTNARKNRSGEAMELLVKPLVERIAGKVGAEVLFQKKFKNVRGCRNIPASLSNRKSDFIIYANGRFLNIEVNYYSGAGSKPEEIVDSYINRRNELKKYDWNFIWITDGNVWRGSESQLAKAFRELDYVMNIEFANRGLLHEAFRQIFKN